MGWKRPSKLNPLNRCAERDLQITQKFVTYRQMRLMQNSTSADRHLRDLKPPAFKPDHQTQRWSGIMAAGRQ